MAVRRKGIPPVDGYKTPPLSNVYNGGLNGEMSILEC